MTLSEELVKSGNWLFRWRSYFPLLLLPVLFAALRESDYFERTWGSGVEGVWEGFCLSVSMAGLLVRCLVAGYVPARTSGRNARKQVAGALNTTGAYSTVRHPLYLGNFFVFMGIAIFVQVWWFAVICLLSFWLYYEKIMLAEEEFLRGKFGVEFTAWAEKTPAFVPRPWLWRKPGLGFSFKSVVSRESNTLFMVFASFCAVDILADIFEERLFEAKPFWLASAAASFLFYLSAVYLKKRTRLLAVKHR